MEVIVFSNYSPQVSGWAPRGLGRKNACHRCSHQNYSLSVCWALRKLRMWETQHADPRELRCISKAWFQWAQILAIHRFLNLGYLVFFNLQKTCYVQTTCPLLQSFYITWLLPTTPPSSPFWTCYLLSSSPRNFHWIKRNSQLLGHMYFFQLTSLTGDLTWTPCIGSWSLNHWTTRGAPPFDFLYLSGLDMGTKSTWLYLKNPIYIAF